MSIEDWHNLKAEHNAQSEILAFLLMIVGVNLLTGGLIVTIMMVGEPIFNPFTEQALNYSSTLGLILTVAGFSIISAGFILVIRYDRKRSWHLREIEKAAMLKSRKISMKSTKEMYEHLAETDEVSAK